jgi:uncharacterized small protein (DUF1192 family)
MAKSKSASRKSAAKKAAKTRKSRTVAKKAAKTREQRTAGKKTAATRKRQVVAKKAVTPRKTKAAVATGVLTTTELDNRIAILRDNLRELVEQAASYSGASDEERMSERIAEQEAKLELLMKQREELSQRGS